MVVKMDEKFVFTFENDGKRMDVWICERIKSLSRSYVRKLIDTDKVKLNGGFAKPGIILKKGDVVKVSIPEPQKIEVKPEKIHLDIIYEDKDIIVVNKERGMVVHPSFGNNTGTLVNALLEHCKNSLSDINGIIRPGIVHRIDKDTTGLLIVAKNNVAHEVLSEMLKEHLVKRVYYAIVDGVIVENLGEIDAPIGRHNFDRKKMAVNTGKGKKAITHFEVIERFSRCTYIRLKLETGRTHQIRVHMAYIGHPVWGDPVYGKKVKGKEFKGQLLHAGELEFNHPVKNDKMLLKAPLPQDFDEALKELLQGDIPQQE